MAYNLPLKQAESPTTKKKKKTKMNIIIWAGDVMRSEKYITKVIIKNIEGKQRKRG